MAEGDPIKSRLAMSVGLHVAVLLASVVTFVAKPYSTPPAEALPIADCSVDAYTVAFGLRNVTGIAAALAEARRVLKPGGRFLCLEFSQVERPLLKRAYDLYSFTVLPRLGAAVAGDREAYQYLVESIRRFPGRRKLLSLMERAGLEQTSVRPLSGGIAAIHSGWRL